MVLNHYQHKDVEIVLQLIEVCIHILGLPEMKNLKQNFEKVVRQLAKNYGDKALVETLK